MNDEIFKQQLLKRLDIIIRVLIEHSQDGSPQKMTDIVGRLDEMGLETASISSIVGKSSSHVSATLRSYKNKKRKGK